MIRQYVARAVACAFGCLVIGDGAAAADAQTAAEFVNPPVVGRSEALADDPTPRDLSVELSIEYRDGELWNPSAQRFDRVHLRSYVIDGTPAETLLGPTIVARPGDTLRVQLTNNLPADDPSCQDHPDSINIPHCFNSTNLHTHGLWVSPSGNSDNVFLLFRPGTSFQHEYAIPSDHPAGTFWYHPHLHGSTALQVTSGMSGALILRGDRMPTADRRGDLDVLLQATPEQPFAERVFLFQQIAYACRDAAGRIKTMPADDDHGVWVCDEDDVGSVEAYAGPVPPNQFGGGAWNDSGRLDSINGVVMPVLRGAKAGQFERWRMIHAGVRDTINLVVRKMDDAAGSIDGLSRAEMYDYVLQNCNGPLVPQHLVAADGLTMERVYQTGNAVMQPGYRWDALIAFPEPGTYCLIDTTDPIGGGMDTLNPHDPELLGTVVVDDGPGLEGTSAEALTAALVAAARQNIAEPMAAAVVADLEDGLGLSAFAAHEDLSDVAADGTQEIVFNIDLTTSPFRYEINGEVFDPANVRRVALGAVDDWVLTSTWDGHPYHIHVNPFQIVEILDPDGKDVSAPDAIDDFTGEVDKQFAGLKGVWKDTIWVKNPARSADTSYTIRVRTRYDRYIGKFVLHCHILDHEDQGMMQIVEIVLPDALDPNAIGGHGDH